MRDRVFWKPVKMDTEAYGHRTVYIRHIAVPFVGLIADADTAFSIPAYVRVAGKKIKGFVTPRDGMAYSQEHAASIFVAVQA